MNTLTKIAALVLVLMAVLLGFMAWRMASAPPPVVAPVINAPTSAAPQVALPTFPVLVAAVPIAAGHALVAEDLVVARWQVALPQGFADASGAIGKTLKIDVGVGEPVLRGQIVSGLSAYLGPDERAVSIAVDDVLGVSNAVTPGDLVDIFISFDKGTEVDSGQTRLLLSRVRVLAYGSRSLDGPSSEAGPAAPARGSVPNSARTAVLALPLQRVNELLLASKAGRLQMALRSPQDMAVPDTQLFAARAPVLTAKPGLSADEKAALALPVNEAFAGDSLVQLGGQKTVPPPPPTGASAFAGAAHAAPTARRATGEPMRKIEIIRAGQPGVVEY
jgi:pilus assembly protein CpaB